METMMNFSDPFVWLVFLTTLLAMGLSLGEGIGNIVLAGFILTVNAAVIHTLEQKQADSAFVYERFAHGDAIECGMWRGEHTLADPAKGWRLLEGRFLHNETILTDPSLCSVIGRKAPEVSWIGEAALYLSMFGVLMLGRLGMFEQQGRTFWSGKKKRRADQGAADTQEGNMSEPSSMRTIHPEEGGRHESD